MYKSQALTEFIELYRGKGKGVLTHRELYRNWFFKCIGESYCDSVPLTFLLNFSDGTVQKQAQFYARQAGDGLSLPTKPFTGTIIGASF
jgi:hypothetical protein